MQAQTQRTTRIENNIEMAKGLLAIAATATVKIQYIQQEKTNLEDAATGLRAIAAKAAIAEIVSIAQMVQDQANRKAIAARKAMAALITGDTQVLSLELDVIDTAWSAETVADNKFWEARPRLIAESKALEKGVAAKKQLAEAALNFTLAILYLSRPIAPTTWNVVQKETTHAIAWVNIGLVFHKVLDIKTAENQVVEKVQGAVSYVRALLNADSIFTQAYAAAAAEAAQQTAR